MRRFSLAAAVLALVATSAAAQIDPETDYRLEVGDRIAITVLEDSGLNTTVLVRPDGKISMPLAGTITAAGRTPEAVQAAIRRALTRDFVEAPTVNVALVGIGDARPRNPQVFVLGQVGRPGVYEIVDERTLDLLQLLALAGGPGVFAATKRIQVRRRDAAGRSEVLLFDYDLIEAGAAPVEFIQLRDGDVVVVPERGLFE